jgi:hypothetical protein
MTNKYRLIQKICQETAQPEPVDIEAQSPEYQAGYYQGLAVGNFQLAQTILSHVYPEIKD